MKGAGWIGCGAAVLVGASSAGAPSVATARAWTQLPRIGQCFSTRVKTVATRLGTPDSGSVVAYADGHIQFAYESSPVAEAFRPGDRVRLCAISLPRDCPPGDNRGVVFLAVNARTGGRWKATDSLHHCGGA